MQRLTGRHYNLPGPRDANVDDASDAQNQYDTGDDYQCVGEHFAAECNGGLRAYWLRWHHRCVDVYRVRSNQGGHVESNIRHCWLLHDRPESEHRVYEMEKCSYSSVRRNAAEIREIYAGVVLESGLRSRYTKTVTLRYDDYNIFVLCNFFVTSYRVQE